MNDDPDTDAGRDDARALRRARRRRRRSVTETFSPYPDQPFEEVEGELVRDYPLVLTRERGAVVTPVVRGGRGLSETETGPASRDEFGGAVYGGAGDLLPHSERRVGAGKRPNNPPRFDGPRPERVETRPSLFAGILFQNFGHVLLEGTSRLWAVSELAEPPERLVFQCFSENAVAKFRRAAPDGYLALILEALGYALDDVDLVVDRPVGYADLVVPESAFAITGYVHPRFRGILAAVGDGIAARHPAPPLGAKLYLSRSRLPDKKRSATNEEEMEAIAAAHGFEIVYPEALSFAQQVAMMRAAGAVAGCDGSAMHLTVFSPPGTQVLVFDTRNGVTQNSINAGFDLDGRRVAVRKAATARSGRLHRWEADLDAVREAFASLR
ncbi:MAG TPA: glycosyltransferase family 61 protein [Sphingomonas sp.]|jgi:hypothetical protein